MTLSREVVTGQAESSPVWPILEKADVDVVESLWTGRSAISITYRNVDRPTAGDFPNML